MKKYHRFLLSVSSGVLLSLAWLGFPGWILFFGFVPLLFVENFFTQRKSEYRGVFFWGHAFLTMLIWNGLTTWWIMYATVIGALLAIITNSFLMSLILWIAHCSRKRLRANLGYIALIVFWISFEFSHFQWDIEWPWLTLGNGFANDVKVIQWYEFTGTLGGSLWILLVNVIFFKIIKSAFDDYSLYQLIKPLTEAILVIIIPVLFSLYLYYTYTEKNDPKKIVIVQPNIDPYSESYSIEDENEKLAKFIRLAKLKTDKQTDFIIGPETVVENYSNWNEDGLNLNPQYLTLNNFIKKYPKTEIIIGISSSIYYPSGKVASYTAREGNGSFFDVFNSALFVGRNDSHQIYHKSKLVSGVEKVPFMKYLGFLKNIFVDLGGSSGNLGRQEDASVFTSDDGTKLAPVICYESVFGEYVTRYVQKGAGLIFIITNDGWWRNSTGYKQHMSFARLRAIETRRSIARSANTGISCFVNQRGDIKQQTSWWTEDVISGNLNINSRITFYVKWGDYIARISLFVGILIALYLLSEKLKEDKKNPH